MTTPAGHPVNKMQRRRNKVKDKPPPHPHREYLDAEFSDEEERRGKIYEKNIKRTHTFAHFAFPALSRFSTFLSVGGSFLSLRLCPLLSTPFGSTVFHILRLARRATFRNSSKGHDIYIEGYNRKIGKELNISFNLAFVTIIVTRSGSLSVFRYITSVFFLMRIERVYVFCEQQYL